MVIEGVSVWILPRSRVSPCQCVSAPGDSALSGCVNTDGVLKLRVTHVLAESMVQRILDSVENAAARKPKIDPFYHALFARVYTRGCRYRTADRTRPRIITGDWAHWVYTALTFLSFPVRARWCSVYR